MACLLLAGAVARAQDVPEKVVEAFRKGNVQYLETHLGSGVELMMDNRAICTDKAGVEHQLDAFFRKNKVRTFEVKHRGHRDGSGFLIGILQTLTGNYRVNCFLKRNDNNQYFIHQIRIDKAEP